MIYRICLLFLLFCCPQSKTEENEPGSGKGMTMKSGPNLKCICRGLHLPEYKKGIQNYYFDGNPAVTFDKRDNYESTKIKGNPKKCSCFEYSEQHNKKEDNLPVLYVRDDGRQIDKYDVTTDKPERPVVGPIEPSSRYGYLMSGKNVHTAVTYSPSGLLVRQNHRQDMEKHLNPVTGHSFVSDKEYGFPFEYPIVREKFNNIKASDYLLSVSEKLGMKPNGRYNQHTEWNYDDEKKTLPMDNDEHISVKYNKGKRILNDDQIKWTIRKGREMDKSELVTREKRGVEFFRSKGSKNRQGNDGKRELEDSMSDETLKDVSHQIKSLLRRKRKSELDKSNGAKMSLEESSKDIVNSVVKQAESIVTLNKNKSAEVLEKIGFGLGVASEVAQQVGSQVGSMMGGKMAQSVLNQVSGGLVIASNAATTIAEQKRSEEGRRKRSLYTSDSETFDNSSKSRIAADNIIKVSNASKTVEEIINVLVKTVGESFRKCIVDVIVNGDYDTSKNTAKNQYRLLKNTTAIRERIRRVGIVIGGTLNTSAGIIESYGPQIVGIIASRIVSCSLQKAGNAVSKIYSKV